jgi:1,4-dihydroxy-2-naphthoyl-CoA hydrolase
MTEALPTVEELVGLMPAAVAMGIRLEDATAEEVRGSVEWAPHRCTAGGVLHGGVLMTLADSAGAMCAYLNLPAGATTSTVESKTNFFRAVRSGAAHATSRPLHVGRSFIVVQTDLTDDGGKPVGQTTQTQAVLHPRTAER